MNNPNDSSLESRASSATKMVFLTNNVCPANAMYVCDYHYNQLVDEGKVKVHSSLLEDAPPVLCDMCRSES
jgi:hypothetical protein